MTIPTGTPILTTEQMRMADQHTIDVEGIPSASLMEEAGKAIVAASQKVKLDGGRVVIVVGVGNNAGDGFVAARLLRNKRIAVTVIPLFPLTQLKPEAAAQANLAETAGVKIRPALSKNDIPELQGWLNRSVIVIDAILGVGLTRPLTGWLAEAVELINQADRPILAVDIPSGIDSDSGEVLGTAIRATATLPIAAYKWGHWLKQGKEYSGQMFSPASIGITAATMQTIVRKYPCKVDSSTLIDRYIVKEAFPRRSFHAYKQSLGHLWVFGGSHGFTGAPRLAAMGAQSVGTGLVSIACPTEVFPIIASASLEVMVHPQDNNATWQKANAIVAGPGWGKQHKVKLAELLESPVPIVLDADALNILAGKKSLQRLTAKRESLTVLTPHMGEASRLLSNDTSEILNHRLDAALSLAEKFNAWVVLKGPQTLVVSPSKQVWLNPFGSANLAVAGTGDILAGMIGGLLAAGKLPEIALPAAVGLHGLAGEESGWHRAGQLDNIIAALAEQFRNFKP